MQMDMLLVCDSALPISIPFVPPYLAIYLYIYLSVFAFFLTLFLHTSVCAHTFSHSISLLIIRISIQICCPMNNARTNTDTHAKSTKLCVANNAELSKFKAPKVDYTINNKKSELIWRTFKIKLIMWIFNGYKSVHKTHGEYTHTKRQIWWWWSDLPIFKRHWNMQNLCTYLRDRLGMIEDTLQRNQILWFQY